MEMNTKKHSLLVEKYRSTKLEDYVGNEHIKNQIQKYLDQDDIQNFIFYGPAGTGKTTLAKLIVNNLDCDYLYINASDERGIETIRDKVTSFSSTASFRQIKVVILDEADFLTIQAQASLRNVIETFSRSTRFIMTCNFIERIIDPLQSRCQVLKIIPPSKKEVAKHLNNILINEILKELKNKKTNYRTLRQIIADSGVKDFEGLYRSLFDNASHYAPGREGSVAMILNEHQYHSNFRIDKEINIASALAKIIEIKKPQVI